MKRIFENDAFFNLSEERKNKAILTLDNKSKEYSFIDRYENFKTGAILTDSTPREVLLGYARKHFVSVLDILEDRLACTLLEEKLGDAFNYLILLIGMKKQNQSLTKLVKNLRIPPYIQEEKKLIITIYKTSIQLLYKYDAPIEFIISILSVLVGIEKYYKS